MKEFGLVTPSNCISKMDVLISCLTNKNGQKGSAYKPLICTLLFIWVGCFQQVAKAQDTVAFYFGAHEDDWQLFMNPNAYHDVHRPSTKVVFVYLTSGDAGAGLGRGGRSQPYYLARENGAKQSVKFIADAKYPQVDPINTSSSFKGHSITKWVYGNTVSYFLRLPDGNPKGTGYPSTGSQTLKLLSDGKIATLTTIDSSTGYRDWQDLKATLRALIDYERGKSTSVWVNIADPDTKRNIGDHEDHLHTSKVVLEAISNLPCINKAFFLDYITAEMPENMNAAEREIEAATFGALVVGLTALDHPSPWDSLHRSWLSRHYYRTEKGKGKCP